jgi:hypothetical protein
MSKRARLILLLALVGTAALATGVRAERSQVENLIVSLNGGIDPRLLPRDHLSPVGVELSAGIRTADGAPIPRVKEIRLELAWRGALDTKGLPVCPKKKINDADVAGALERCGPALVGHGGLSARIFLPGQTPFGLHSRLLAFNGKTQRGLPAVWVLAYSADPPVAVVLPFHVRHQKGSFHTVLVSVVPRSVGPWPHFANFHMAVSRRFTYKGRHRSYLVASCPLPRGFTAGFLSFARATFLLEDAPTLSVETVRSCRAR